MRLYCIIDQANAEEEQWFTNKREAFREARALADAGSYVDVEMGVLTPPITKPLLCKLLSRRHGFDEFVTIATFGPVEVR